MLEEWKFQFVAQGRDFNDQNYTFNNMVKHFDLIEKMYNAKKERETNRGQRASRHHPTRGRGQGGRGNHYNKNDNRGFPRDQRNPQESQRNVK